LTVAVSSHAEALLRTIDLPLSWAEQRSVLGFAWVENFCMI
jgi:hypothetical protein